MKIPEPLHPLPTAIFVPTREDFFIYRGAPDEMVASMAKEMGESSIEQAVQNVLLALALHRRIVITLPDALDEKDLSALFVSALLDSKIAHPMAQA